MPPLNLTALAQLPRGGCHTGRRCRSLDCSERAGAQVPEPAPGLCLTNVPVTFQPPSEEEILRG